MGINLNTRYSHDWNYEVENRDGQEEEPESHMLVSILAATPEEAEKRVMAYVRGNFDDGNDFTRFVFEGTVTEDKNAAEGEKRHFVTMYFPFRY